MATQHPKLKVEKRTVLGKKVKNLRKDGVLPANIYGKGIKSESVSVKLKDFEAIYKETGETGLVELQLDDQTRPVLIKNLQLEYVERNPVHVDFYQVNLKEKVKTMVPIEVVGEPKAVTDKLGLLLTPISEVEVEALPADLPEKIEVNVENLAAVGDQITVSQLKVPSTVTILTDSEQVVVKIDELVSKKTAELAQQMAEEAAAAQAPAEGEEKAPEGETPTEGKQPTEAEKPAEAKPEEPKSEEKTKE